MTAEAESCGCDPKKNKYDWVLIGGGAITAAAIVFTLWDPTWIAALPRLRNFSHFVTELLGQMWWGLLFGVSAIGILHYVPRDWICAALGRGIWRAIGLGLLFDLCSHGILMVGAKLYERGATIGQTFAFLIASPWNSFSLTLILIGLIGLKWTLTFIGLSAVVAFTTGWIADWLVGRGRLPCNLNRSEPDPEFQLWPAIRSSLKKIDWKFSLVPQVLWTGLRHSTSLIRWLLFGLILAALLRVWLPTETFSTWFGATWIGLSLTMVATTVLEICSEGSSPIAADLLNRAKAPGNAFAFLMGGVATDYTEVMILRETTKSWKLAFALALISIPQVVLLGWTLNQFTSHA